MNGFYDINLSDLTSPHLPDDLPSPEESHRSTKAHLPSIPQGKELIIPVNGPPCHIRQTEIVVADLTSLTTSNYTHDLPNSCSLEIKEQITMVVESSKGSSGSPKRSSAARTISNDKAPSSTTFSTSSESSSCSNTTTTATNSPSSSKVVSKPIKSRQRCLSESVTTPVVHHKTNISPKSHKFFGRLRLFSLSGDRSRSSNSTTEPMDESGSTPLSPGCELTPPHLIPKAKNLASQRLEFSGKPILNNNKYLLKQRPRRLSGHFPQSIDINASLSPLDFSSDFARSCPDRDSMNCFGLMSELMSAVDILSARQNQWNSSNDAKSTIQVLEAAQSSTLLFVRKSVDEPDDEAGKPKDLRYFDEDSACSMFFRHSTCYDVLPESGKLLVLDSTLPIRRAMQALIDHSLSAAPVWCNRLQCYTQLLTTDLCLRLLAQAFPLDASSSSPSSTIGNDEDVSVRKRNSDPNVSMSYWEDKTIDSVLKTFFNWAHAECPQQAVPELVTMVTPQDHLYHITRILTLAVPASASSEATTAKTSILNTTPPPRYVLIADRYGSGNLLGLLNSDRLLAYLRVRMRNLPTPSALKASVSSLSGIRWEQRGWQTADSTCLHDGESDPPPGENRRSTPQRILSSSGDSFYLQPKTTCLEALHIITRAWNEAGLSCLPVATENGTGFQGMLTKHDILGTIFAGPLDVALNASIGTILSVRPRPTGFTNQAMCFTSECLVAVLDRMFRQKASCLVVFDKPGSGASWNGQGALGKAIGVITAADLLQAIVIDAPTPPPSASYAEIPEDAVFSKTPSQVKGRYPTRSGGGGNKRHSLPPEMANSLPGAQILSPFSNHQHGLTKIFHRTKRNSESEVSPLEGPFATAANSNTAGSNGQSHRPHSHQPGKTNTTPSNQHNGDDGTLFEMDECV